MKQSILLISALILLFSCSSQICNELPNEFETFENAQKQIDNSTFLLSEDVDVSKSSWIRKLSYFSCDNQFGYLIIQTDKGYRYIYQNVPIKIWNEFKIANSFGEYYNEFIKGNYHLKLN